MCGLYTERGFAAFCAVSHKGFAVILLMAGRGGVDIDKKKARAPEYR